jgi:hypothetical protein
MSRFKSPAKTALLYQRPSRCCNTDHARRLSTELTLVTQRFQRVDFQVDDVCASSAGVPVISHGSANQPVLCAKLAALRRSVETGEDDDRFLFVCGSEPRVTGNQIDRKDVLPANIDTFCSLHVMRGLAIAALQ